jgi:hypothetical protein
MQKVAAKLRHHRIVFMGAGLMHRWIVHLRLRFGGGIAFLFIRSPRTLENRFRRVSLKAR